jgi:hypothetical protein
VRRTRKKGTERKTANKHLLEACKVSYVKAGRARKGTKRKMDNTHLLEAWEAIFKHTEKERKSERRRVKGRKER